LDLIAPRSSPPRDQDRGPLERVVEAFDGLHQTTELVVGDEARIRFGCLGRSPLASSGRGGTSSQPQNATSRKNVATPLRILILVRVLSGRFVVSPQLIVKAARKLQDVLTA
jgi:hypothetical protein